MCRHFGVFRAPPILGCGAKSRAGEGFPQKSSPPITGGGGSGHSFMRARTSVIPRSSAAHGDVATMARVRSLSSAGAAHGIVWHLRVEKSVAFVSHGAALLLCGARRRSGVLESDR